MRKKNSQTSAQGGVGRSRTQVPRKQNRTSYYARNKDESCAKKIKTRVSDFQVVDFVHEGRASNIDVHNLDRGAVIQN